MDHSLRETPSTEGSEWSEEDLSEAEDRPNRWTGPKSTWQAYNSEEIDTLTALNELRNRDLSAHLYNAFDLKQKRNSAHSSLGPVPNHDINAATGQTVQRHDWKPPRNWTAWPMIQDRPPSPSLMSKTADDDEFTARGPSLETPSAALEEAISATVLRFAKEQFQRRPSPEGQFSDQGLSSGSDDEDGDDTSQSRSRSRSVKSERKRQGQSMDLDDSSSDERTVSYQYRPVISTDDDVSYALVQPPVRQVLENLDKTLSILHNMQEAALNMFSESSDSEASSNWSRQSRERSASRGHSKPTIDTKDADSFIQKLNTHNTRGRPKRFYPREEGETNEDYVLRITRLKKRKAPTTIPKNEAEIDSGFDPENDDSSADNTGEEIRRKHQTSKRQAEIRSRQAAEKPWFSQQHGLRDWQDVIGAASLAGFSPAVLDRAARRCADLFGRNMNLGTYVEAPLGGSTWTEKTYTRGMSPPPPLFQPIRYEELDEQKPHLPERQATTPEATSGTDRGGMSSSRAYKRSVGSSRGRSRSQSASSVGGGGGGFNCPISVCHRAVDAFTRRANLMRHMKLVHGTDGGDTIAAEEMDSEDEMHGAVHVDWYMKPIKIRAGWRGADTTASGRPSAAAPTPKKRGRPRKRQNPDDRTDESTNNRFVFGDSET